MNSADAVSRAWELARLGDTKEFKKCFDKNTQPVRPNARINDPNIDPQTLMQVSALSNSKGCLEFLVSLGADPNLRNFNGYSPLHFAAFSGAAESASYLVGLIDERLSTEAHQQKVVDINQRAVDGRTPLHIACARGHASVVSILISNGADVNCCNCEGKTPIFDAIVGNHSQVVALLVQAGADVYHMTADKQTPSVVAKEFKRDWFIRDYISAK